MSTNTKKCPSCGGDVDGGQMICPNCGWQFSSPTLSGTRAAAISGRGPTVARGVTRPNWICSNACQLAVLVRDASGSMSGKKARDASDASLDLVRVLGEPSNKDGFYVGDVDFADRAKTVHPATKASVLAGNMAELKAGLFGGSTNITSGLELARDIVVGFAPGDNRKVLRPVIALFTDGCHNVGPRPDAVASALKAEADLICIAFGSDADEQGLRQWASPNMFMRCASGADLRRFFATVGATMQATRAKGINATQALANIQVP